MPNRRVVTCCVVAAVGSVAVAACGSDAGDGSNEGRDEVPDSSPVATTAESTTTDVDDTAEEAAPAGVGSVPDRAIPTTDTRVAGTAITDFGLDLFGEVRSVDPTGNVIISPASVAIALAMLEPGAVDEAASQLAAALRIDDPVTFHDSMNALELDLEARAPQAFSEDDDPGEVAIRIANAAFLQDGYPFRTDYLDTIGASYGPVLREVDFAADPDAVGRRINDFVAEATDQKIVDLIADGTIRPETVLALVNALHLRASWLETFDESATETEPFTLLDGSAVDVPLMQGSSGSSAAGDGWVGATKEYVGGLRVQFVLPDEGRFDEIAANLGAAIDEYDANRQDGARLGVPRFEARTSTELTEALVALGLTAPYAPGGLTGIADDPQLVVDQVRHEAVVAMDEEGTEAAAATVVLAFATSGPSPAPVPVVLDRPFLFRIVDDTSGATLFVGQITDPSG